MIIKGLFDLVYSLLNIILTPFSIVPDMNSQVDALFQSLLDFLFAPINVLLYFNYVPFLRAYIPIILIVINMEHIWDGIIWILKKLPFVGIE